MIGWVCFLPPPSFMRRLSIALATFLSLSPLVASAAFMTPAALMTAVHTGTPRSFSLMAHAQVPDETYVSVWANGSMQGVNPEDLQLMTKVTLDVVSGDFKIRAKGEVMAVSGMLYLKLASVDGSMQSDFATLSAKLVQHKWLKTGLDTGSLDLVQNPVLGMSGNDTEADDTFSMATKADANGTTYTLTLKPDAAAQLALMIRELLNDTDSVSDDFFPWRDLAEGMRFEMIVKTDAKDAFAGSSYSMSTKGTNSAFTLTGTEKPTSALNLKAPADAMTFDQLAPLFGSPMYFDGSADEMMEPIMELDEDMFDSSYVPGTFDMLDDDTLSSCDDPAIDGAMLVMLQREGSCPITRASTRR